MKNLLRICAMAINSINFDQSELVFQVVLRAVGETGVPVKQYRDIITKIHARRASLMESVKDVQSTKSDTEVTVLIPSELYVPNMHYFLHLPITIIQE